MKLTQIKGRTWYLDGYAYIGVYLLDGGRCVLLDSGQRWEREEIAAALAEQGLTVAGILVTHIHTDHAVNNGWFREKTGCLTAAPAGETHLIRDIYSLQGYLPCMSPGMLRARFADMVCPVDCPVPLEDGVFQFCGVPFRIVHTPGHSEDHICVITPDNVCMVGDAAFGVNDNSKLPYGYCIERMLESTGRLLELDCDWWLLAHRELREDIAPAVEHTRALILRRAEEMQAQVTEPMTASELWEKVSVMYSLHTDKPINSLLLERNFGLYLHYLEDRGSLKMTAEHGVARYCPPDWEEGAHEA